MHLLRGVLSPALEGERLKGSEGKQQSELCAGRGKRGRGSENSSAEKHQMLRNYHFIHLCTA